MCISSARFFVLVNGSPRGFFGASNGLRQGDPLSPLLFIVAAHVLNRMLALGVSNNLISGIQFPNGGPQVLNIQYADDTLLFLSPEEQGIINLKRILGCFQACSGLKINFGKSSITGIQVLEDQVLRFSSILECTPSALSVTYLELPLHLKKAAFNDWAPVLDKITAKLESWKATTLSRGGRLILVNSVLSAIPTYYLSVLHLPKRVEAAIDRIRRQFLWKNFSSTNTGYSFVRWQNICRSKEQDGLGIINLGNFNLALKCKYMWNLMDGSKKLKWPSLVLSRYCSSNRIGAILNRTSNGSSPFWRELKKYFPVVNMLSTISIENGEKNLYSGSINGLEIER